MFVEATPRGELIKLVKETEENHIIAANSRIKFVEKCGQKLINTVRINYPFRRNCENEECMACKDTNKYSNCRKSNIGYTIKCKDCEKKGLTRAYEGESCRNMYTRSLEHQRLYKNKHHSSFMYKHALQDHSESPDQVKYTMSLAGTHRNSLSRIINEGIRIKERRPEELLNSKREFHGPSVKRRVLK